MQIETGNQGEDILIDPRFREAVEFALDQWKGRNGPDSNHSNRDADTLRAAAQTILEIKAKQDLLERIYAGEIQARICTTNPDLIEVLVGNDPHRDESWQVYSHRGCVPRLAPEEQAEIARAASGRPMKACAVIYINSTPEGIPCPNPATQTIHQCFGVGPDMILPVCAKHKAEGMCVGDEVAWEQDVQKLRRIA